MRLSWSQVENEVVMWSVLFFLLFLIQVSSTEIESCTAENIPHLDALDTDSMSLSTPHRFTTLAGLSMPVLIYGTAWKKERTKDLVVQAVLAGFRGIDTACQPKHYQENLVGDAIKELSERHNIKRQDLFVQTKFTPIDGQDPQRIPYNKTAPLASQVRESFAVSQKNLGSDYIDSLVLHSPLKSLTDTLAVWRVFEKLHGEGHVGQLGISNIYDLHLLQQIWDAAVVKPAVIQNRFHSQTEYDRDLRAFCRKHHIIYQSFWTLTANPHILQHHDVLTAAQQSGRTPAQLLFRFLIQRGVAPLTGTKDAIHMREDLMVQEMELNDAEMRLFASLINEPYP